MEMKKLGIVLGLIFCAFMAIILWASGGIQSPKTVEGIVHDFGAGPQSESKAGNTMVVLTWNIAYSHGSGSEGMGYILHTAEEMADHLKRIGEVIRDSGADLVLLQEIDFDSDRSHNIDQLEELSHITGLRYAARAVDWKANYVPFPYWPPRYHFGRMYSGGAVLSRYPITSNHVTLHPKPDSNSLLYNLFYLFRHSQHVQIQWGNLTVGVINNHLEAYDRANREKQARALDNMVRELMNAGMLAVVGGDMNTVPPEASVQHDFPGNKNLDFRGDTTLSILRELPGFKEVVKEESYLSNESDFFTFPADAPNRRLDYLFVHEDISIADVRVIPTGNLSDHLPVRAELMWLSLKE